MCHFYTVHAGYTEDHKVIGHICRQSSQLRKNIYHDHKTREVRNLGDTKLMANKTEKYINHEEFVWQGRPV